MSINSINSSALPAFLSSSKIQQSADISNDKPHSNIDKKNLTQNPQAEKTQPESFKLTIDKFIIKRDPKTGLIYEERAPSENTQPENFKLTIDEFIIKRDPVTGLIYEERAPSENKPTEFTLVADKNSGATDDGIFTKPEALNFKTIIKLNPETGEMYEESELIIPSPIVDKIPFESDEYLITPNPIVDRSPFRTDEDLITPNPIVDRIPFESDKGTIEKEIDQSVNDIPKALDFKRILKQDPETGRIYEEMVLVTKPSQPTLTKEEELPEEVQPIRNKNSRGNNLESSLQPYNNLVQMRHALENYSKAHENSNQSRYLHLLDLLK